MTEPPTPTRHPRHDDGWCECGHPYSADPERAQVVAPYQRLVAAMKRQVDAEIHRLWSISDKYGYVGEGSIGALVDMTNAIGGLDGIRRTLNAAAPTPTTIDEAYLIGVADDHEEVLGPTPASECTCEGEFVWACGPECDCYHHAEPAPAAPSPAPPERVEEPTWPLSRGTLRERLEMARGQHALAAGRLSLPPERRSLDEYKSWHRACAAWYAEMLGQLDEIAGAISASLTVERLAQLLREEMPEYVRRSTSLRGWVANENGLARALLEGLSE